MIERIRKTELMHRVADMKNNGYRLVTMSAVNQDDSIEYIYHFDKDLQMVNFAVTLHKNENPESISGIFSCALLVENEIQDHFGVSFENLALDFKGAFLLEDEVQNAPFCSMGIRREESNAEENK
ncbi:MAG: NADH-quinone oxidoreductase subunit C [Thermodesulfobacteriota bacterium]